MRVFSARPSLVARPSARRRLAALVLVTSALAPLVAVVPITPLAATSARAASTLYVGPGGGDPPCASPTYTSIADAVAAAADGDTIHLCAGTYDLSSTGGQQGPVVVSKVLTFVGDDSSTTIIDGGNDSRLFNETTTGTITFSDLTFTRGNASSYNYAGAITAAGNVVLTNAVFTSNYATGDWQSYNVGGAVSAAGSVSATNVGFTGNSVNQGKGGAIYAGGNVTVNGTGFYNNARAFGNEYGGAIYAGGNVTSTSSDFSGNTTYVGGSGGAIAAPSGTVTVSGGTFTENVAGGFQSQQGFGGAIFARYASIDGATFVRNRSFSGGGAVYAESNFAGNGGTIAVTGGTFTDNTTASNGGALWADKSIAVAGGAVFSGNRGTDGGAIFGENTGLDTGAVSIAGGSLTGNVSTGFGGAVSGRTVTSTGVTYTDNTAGSSGGAISAFRATVSGGSFTTNRANTNGGAIWTTYTGSVSNASFVSNRATSNGGAIGFSNAASVQGSLFSDNSAGTNGGAIWANDALTAWNSTFSANRAPSGGGIYGATMTVKNATFSGNLAVSTGGALEGGATTLANNLFGTTTDRCSIGLTDSGGNVAAGSNSGCISLTQALSEHTAATNIHLSPLASNGGPTQTMAIDGTSAAAGYGVAAVCAAAATVNGVDQRGFGRSATACSSGAYEFDGTPVITVLPAGAGSCGGAPGCYAVDDYGSANGALAAAFADAPAGGTITLTGGRYDLTTGITIDKAVKLVGDGTSGTGATVLDGSGGTTGLLRFTTTDPVSVTGIAFKHGQAADGYCAEGSYACGAAIVAFGDLTISSSSFIDNTAGLGIAGFGGAVFTDGNLAISNSTFSGNSAQVDSGTIGGQGGAVYASAGTVSVTDATFVGNHADAYGGAIQAGGGVTVDGGTFSANTAGASGGAIQSPGPVTVTGGVTFSGNTVALGNGGAISAGAVSVDGATFSGNTVADGDGGGAINSFSSVSITDGTFSGNQALVSEEMLAINGGGNGGAILAKSTVTLNGGTFTDNTAGVAGGAVFSFLGVSAVGGTFTGNSATLGDGGAICSPSGVSSSDGTFNGNSAPSGNGGAIGAHTVSLTDGTFDGNSALSGGAVYVFATSGPGSLTSTGGTYTNNHATGEGSSGGAIAVADGPVSLTGDRFSGNSAEEGGAVAALNTSSTSPGFSITDGTFSSNTAKLGGAVFSLQDLRVAGSTFDGNASTAAGGAIFVEGGNPHAWNSTFFDNSAGTAGGAIHAAAVTLSVTSVTFAQNRAIQDASSGAISAQNDLVLANSIFATPDDRCLQLNGRTDNGGNIAVTDGTNASGCIGMVSSNAPTAAPGAPTLAIPQPGAASMEVSAGTGGLANDLHLSPLANNGGTTKTMALGSTSVAIAYGVIASCSDGTTVNGLDQRGLDRHLGDTSPTCDSGAFEYSAGTSRDPKATPTISTQVDDSTGQVGVSMTAGDTATLTGGRTPGGTIHFVLYSDAACTVSVTSGDGTISAASAHWSTSWTPATEGTYYWIASYAGDGRNDATSGTCGDTGEQIVVGPAGPPAPPAPYVAPGNAWVTVAWPAIADASTYTIVGSPSGGCTVAAPTTSCTITGLSDGTQYIFTLAVTIAGVTSDPSPGSTATPTALPTRAPGAGTAQQDGVPVSVVVSVTDGSTAVQVDASDALCGAWSLKMTGLNAALAPLTVAADGTLQLLQVSNVRVDGTCFMPSTFVYLYLYPGPTFLGTLSVDPSGNFTGILPLPGGQTLGNFVISAVGMAAVSAAGAPTPLGASSAVGAPLPYPSVTSVPRSVSLPLIVVRSTGGGGGGGGSGGSGGSGGAAPQALSFTPPSGRVGGSSALPIVTGAGLPLTWTSTTPAVCTVGDGKVRFIARGTCVLTATQGGTGAWQPFTATYSLGVRGVPRLYARIGRLGQLVNQLTIAARGRTVVVKLTSRPMFAGTTVEIWRKLAGGRWVKVGVRRLSSTGVALYQFTARAGAQYRWRFAGNGSWVPAWSNLVVLRLR